MEPTSRAKPENLAKLLRLGLDENLNQATCEFADRCQKYQTALADGGEEAEIMIDEVCGASVRFYQNCYKEMQRTAGK